MTNTINEVSKQLNIDTKQIETVLELLGEGSTVPFIARYRKSATGGLDEEQIEAINKGYKYNLELNERKEAIKNLLKESGLLTPELLNNIDSSKTKSELENIYAPFKLGKKTKATEAIALGLEQLAKDIFTKTDEAFNPMSEAQKYLNDKVPNIEFAIEQAKLIIAQYMSQDIKARDVVKFQIKNYGNIITKKKPKAEDEKEKFKQYYDHKELVRGIPNHRVLAIGRAENLKVVTVKFEYSEKKIKFDLNDHFFKTKRTGKIIFEALEDSLKRLMIPSIEREVRKELFEKAEIDSIKLFGNNLEEMLLAPAVKGKTIIAIDPAFASGCKVAVVSPEGDVLAIDLIKQNAPFNKVEEAENKILGMISKFKAQLIVIGNGTASRETEAFITDVLKKAKDVKYAIVSEVGASVYSASKIAIDEFPELSVEQRSAIHIGRKIQDPLNELVKVDPKSIGVGQYQHDINQKELKENLKFKVNKVVNQVGVDLNTATKEILTYVSGLSNKIAENIVTFRKENGKFNNRKELKKVKGLGSKAFEQSIGFLRIHDSDEFFDRTQIHPESYKLAKQIVKELKIDLKNIDSEAIETFDANELATKLDASKYDVELILESIKAPGKDIRESNEGPMFKSDILTIENLTVGDILEGSVQNITDFGAFIYIGLKQAALAHISNLSSKFIKHPSEAVKTGEKVTVEVIGIEKERGRVQVKLLEK